MEAMACGLPAVCSNIRGNTDLIDDGVTGLISNNTPEELAEAINKMRNDTDLRDRLASAALQKIKQFDLSSVEDEMTKIYRGGVSNLALQGVYKGQEIRKELGIPLDAKVVLSVGEVNKNKNHKVGIEALAKLNDPDVYYVICGRGPLMDAHKELAKELGVGDRVVLTGYRTDVADFYKMADVFLFPSFREGLPVAVMEAMASRLPVVATKIRGSSDLVQQGALFDPTDADGMAKAIEKMQPRKVKHETDVFEIHKVMESMNFNTTSHRCTRNRSIPYWNIQQLYCYTAGWCQLVLLHQCFPDDVHNSEGDPQALHFKEIDSDCSTLLDHDSVYFCCNAIYSVNFNGGGYTRIR